MKALKRLGVIAIIMLMVFPIIGFAHSGRTDSNGGHKDNNNASGLGHYHYHHGRGPHLHPDGVCPYAKVAPTEAPQTRSNVSDVGEATPTPSVMQATPTASILQAAPAPSAMLVTLTPRATAKAISKQTEEDEEKSSGGIFTLLIVGGLGW